MDAKIQEPIYAIKDFKNYPPQKIPEINKNGILIFDSSTEDIEFVSIQDNNKIREIHFKTQQNKLRYLNISRCAVGKIIFSQKCENLKSIYIHGTEDNSGQLSHFEINADLPDLQLLDLSFNDKLSEININTDLPGLKYLYLHKCDFKNLQNLAKYFVQPGFDFNIEKNENLQSPPVEIVNQGKEAVKNYFESIYSAEKLEVDYLFEAKLILVGEERAGKSTIAKALSEQNFKINLQQPSTEGIDVLKWDISKTDVKTDNDFHFNIWDFGGQEIYHATHQFFLTKRSLYLFVTEARKDLRFDDFYYWLNIIHILAGDSPVIVVQNKVDQSHGEASIEEYKKTFTAICDDLQKVSCNTEHEQWQSRYSLTLEMLKQAIFDVLRNKSLPGIGDELPKAWVAVRKEIAKLQNQDLNYISLREYYKICKEHGLDKERAIFLSDYFHDLGVFLHFRNDLQLRNIIFLNYEWVTKGIYNVFDNEKIKNKTFGRFTDEDLIDIWDEPQFAEKQPELLNLMKNREFKICYQHKDGYYLAPQLFSDNEPAYAWRTNENNLIFRYNYSFMPKGILSQLIVMLNQYILKDTYWKYGVLFDYKNSRAIVTEKRFKNENIISIRVEGTQKRELLSLIGNDIEEINKSYTNLIVSEEIACNCDECKVSDNPHYFDTKTINNFINKKKKHVVCVQSTELVEINNLLGNYIPIEQIQAYQRGGTTNITNIYSDSNTVGQGIKGSFSFEQNEKRNKKQAGIAEKLDEITNNTQELKKGQELIISIQNITRQELSKLSVSQQEGYNSIIELIETSQTVFFESNKEEKEFQNEINLFIREIKNEKEREKAQKLIDSNRVDVTAKLKFAIPFIIGKYELEFATKKKVPRTWNELKALFTNKK